MSDEVLATLPFGPIADRDADAIAAHQARRAERDDRTAEAASLN